MELIRSLAKLQGARILATNQFIVCGPPFGFCLRRCVNRSRCAPQRRRARNSFTLLPVLMTVARNR